MLLEILQNWQENTCVRVSFLIKLQVWGFRAARWVNLIRKLWHSFQISKRCLIKSRNSHLQGLLNIGAPKININYVNNKKSEHFLTILRSNSNGCIREFFFFTVNAISSLMLIFALIGQGNFYIAIVWPHRLFAQS